MHKIMSIGKHLTTFNVTAHSHDYWEVVCCTSGNGEFVTKNGTKEYTKGETVVVPPGVIHSNNSKTGFTNIHLIMDELRLPSDSLTKIADNPSRILYHAFSQAFYVFNCDMNNKFTIISILGDLIGTSLASFINTEHFSPLVEKLQTDIIKNFTDSNFNLKNIMSEKAYSADYLRKMFTKETGITPLQFLIDTRISYAKKLLSAKITLNKSVKEIAHECGFDDALYFSRLFKQYVGSSPAQFADQFR